MDQGMDSANKRQGSGNIARMLDHANRAVSQRRRSDTNRELFMVTFSMALVSIPKRVEHSVVNREAVGSNPTRGANSILAFANPAETSSPSCRLAAPSIRSGEARPSERFKEACRFDSPASSLITFTGTKILVTSSVHSCVPFCRCNFGHA